MAKPRVKKGASAKKTGGRKTAAQKPKKKVRAAKPSESVFPVELEPGSVERTLVRVREELSKWVKKGRYTKVRFKLRGKPILPDLPVGAVLAAEAMTFWWAGLLRALLFTVGAKTVLDVELVSDADHEVARGKDLLLAGELDQALGSFEKAVDMDQDCAAGHLNIGIAQRLKGDPLKARAAFSKAREKDPDGPVGAEAARLLAQMSPPEQPGTKPSESGAA